MFHTQIYNKTTTILSLMKIPNRSCSCSIIVCDMCIEMEIIYRYNLKNYHSNCLISLFMFIEKNLINTFFCKKAVSWLKVKKNNNFLSMYGIITVEIPKFFFQKKFHQQKNDIVDIQVTNALERNNNEKSSWIMVFFTRHKWMKKLMLEEHEWTFEVCAHRQK